MQKIQEFVKRNRASSIVIFFSSFVAISYFVIPWLNARTIYMYRWDEAVFFFIHSKIVETGSIPQILNYIGGIHNYNYPTLYMGINNLLIVTGYPSSLHGLSIALQLILFIALTVSSLYVYKIALLIAPHKKFAVISGSFFLLLPIISYRLFYLHATFYANFVAITFMFMFIYYLLRYRKKWQKPDLILSIVFYGMTLFTHQLVFMMATIFLFIDFILSVRGSMKIQVIEKIYFVTGAILLNLGYIATTPIFQKILSLLGIRAAEQFGQEMASKPSASTLPPLISPLLLIISIIVLVKVLRSKTEYGLKLFAWFFIFLSTSITANSFGIHLPASFRYDTFLIICLPFLLAYFILNLFPTGKAKSIFTGAVIVFFLTRIFSITNGFTDSELRSVKQGLAQLNCSNTVSYFRIAPWVPAVSKSGVYYAHVDTYNAHQDRLEENVKMFSNSLPLEERVSLIKEKKVDCLLYEKNILVQDNIRIKGWEEYRYSELYRVSDKQYEDNNLVIFKFGGTK